MNSVLLNNQCECLKRALDLCNDSNFIVNYENELQESLEKRRNVFKQWEEHYLLNNFL